MGEGDLMGTSHAIFLAGSIPHFNLPNAAVSCLCTIIVHIWAHQRLARLLGVRRAEGFASCLVFWRPGCTWRPANVVD